MQPKIASILVQKGEKSDDCLKTQLLDVNMRLYNHKTERGYRKVVKNVIEYMESVLGQHFRDYGELKGISGANLAIPFNIVVVRSRSRSITMINPKIIKMSRGKRELSSNCGSLNLPKNHPVKRREWVVVSYYGVDGKYVEEKFSLDDVGGTVQHEVDHNRGVLITDNKRHL